VLELLEVKGVGAASSAKEDWEEVGRRRSLGWGVDIARKGMEVTLEGG
jgi:hypothetical protein